MRQWTAILRFVSLTRFASLFTLPPLQPGHSRLFLCRHGQTEGNQLKLMQGGGIDTPLNPTGRAQAAALAQSMSSVQLDLVASSTLSRAVETADFIANAQGNRAIERAARTELSEQDFGVMEGLPRQACKEQLADLNAAWCAGRTDMRVEGGESLDDVLARASEALFGDGLLGSRTAGRQVLCVGHSTLNKAVISDVVGKGLPRIGEIRQANCCINVIDVAIADGQPSAVAVNIEPEAADVPQLAAMLRVCWTFLLSGQRA